MSNLQRASSAPQTVAGLTQQRIKLARSKSHLHVEKQPERPYLKPLVTSLAASSPGGDEREDPFHLAGFFPPEGGRWRWLGAEEEDPEGSAEDAIRREDKLGVLSLFSRGGEGRLEEGRLLSPYRLEPAGDWDAVYQDLTERRRLAEGRLGDAGGDGN